MYLFLKKIRILIISIVLTIPLSANTPTFPVEYYFYNHKINIDSKSYKGWIRVLVSSAKRKKYHIYINNQQQKLYIKNLLQLNKNQIKGKL